MAGKITFTGNITLGTWARVLTLEQAGFKDAVVWNPGAADTAALADMEDDEYQRFVCIEPAQLAPVELAPGAVARPGQFVIREIRGSRLIVSNQPE